MGYGPCDENRFGWCWRNEHGSGTRMTPYFKSEEDCCAFHDFFTEGDYSSMQRQMPPGQLQLQPQPYDGQVYNFQTTSYCDDILVTLDGLLIEGWDGIHDGWRPYKYSADTGGLQRRINCANPGDMSYYMAYAIEYMKEKLNNNV
jgi:hypothetical protein